jgi:uncharacterized protein YraI
MISPLVSLRGFRFFPEEAGIISNMKRLLIPLLLTIFLLLTGCSPSSENQISLAYTAAAGTAMVMDSPAAPTATVPPTYTPLPTATATPAWITTAFIAGGPLNLRQGPGTFFDAYGSLADGTKLYVLGSMPGGEWFQVLAPDPTADRLIVGWMNTNYLEITSFLGTIPILEWPQDQTIYGSVTDENGVPINGIRVAAVYQTESEEIRNDIPTNDQGEFSIYLPQRVAGPYDVQIIAVNCDSWISVWLDDGTCEVQDYIPVKWRSNEYMPLERPVHFYYERAVTHLNGKVSFADGWGYPNILVKATRLEDGVESERVTPGNGRVSIPLGFGTWELVAIKFDWYGVPTFSDRVTYVVTEEGQQLDDFLVIIDDIDNPE